MRVGYADTLWGCPQCRQRMHIHAYEERRWRHLDSCQFQTIILSRVPVVKCPVHGCQTVAVPWAEKYARFTRLFERLAIDVMLECSITGACAILGISWSEADGIKQRAVKRGLARKQPAVMARLCVDEKGMGRGHDYLTIVAQVTRERTTVEYVGEEREKESLDAFWKSLSAEQLAGVEAVAMDMWEPFVRSTLAHLPQATSKIVHDPFHLVKHMNEAVNDVRVSEHRRLLAAGDATLKGTRQLWLYGLENVPARQGPRFEQNLRNQPANLPGLGAQGGVPQLLAVRHGDGGQGLLCQVVWLGDPQPARTRKEGSAHVQEPLGSHPDLLYSPADQRPH